MYHAKEVLREISLLRKLSKLKENIFTVRLHDVLIQRSEEFDDVFLVQDYYENSLKDILSEDRDEFTEEHAKVILYNLACCLRFVHSAGIMHRDLKPANILIDDRCQVKLCDFGQARTIPKRLRLLDKFYQDGLSDKRTISSIGSPEMLLEPLRDVTTQRNRK